MVVVEGAMEVEVEVVAEGEGTVAEEAGDVEKGGEGPMARGINHINDVIRTY